MPYIIYLMDNVLLRDAHCEITMGNNVVREIHCNVTMINDVAMCTYNIITVHNDVAMTLFYCIFSLLIMMLLCVVWNKTKKQVHVWAGEHIFVVFVYGYFPHPYK